MPVRRMRRRMGSLSGFFNKTKEILKRTKLLSTVGRVLAPMAGSYSGLVNKAIDYGETQGYGLRRIRRRGGALRPAGRDDAGGCLHQWEK